MTKLRVISISIVAAGSFTAGLALPQAFHSAAPAQGDSCTLAACSTATSTAASPPPPPPPPPPPSTTAPVTSPPPVVRSAPPPAVRRAPRPAVKPRPPARVADLRAGTPPRGIELRWRLPAGTLSRVVIRRTPAGACAATVHAGISIGGTRVRSSQLDGSARQAAPYCYAVFTVGHAGGVSRPATADRVVLPDRTPPAPIAGLTARVVGGDVVLRWPAPAGSPTHYLVRRTAGQICPTSPISGELVGRPVSPGFTDDRVNPGITYCYAVFAVDAAGNVQPGYRSAAPGVAVPRPRPRPAAAAGSSPVAAGSGLLRIGLATLVAALVFAVAVAGGLRALRPGDLRRPGHALDAGSLGLTRVDVRAMVIPAVLAVVALLLFAAAAALTL